MLDEEKGTCCHKCGHVHVKGTSCPTPFLKGDRSCVRRSLKEAELKDHYIDRKKERGTIIDIEINSTVYKDRDDKAVKDKLITVLQKKLDERLTFVESMDIGKSNNVNLGLIVFMPVLAYNNKSYPIKMKCNDGGDGYYYLVIAANNALLTLYPSLKKPSELEGEVVDHIKRNRPNDTRPAKVSELSGYLYKIDIDGNEVSDVEKKPEVSKADASELPYAASLAADYRKGRRFEFTDEEGRVRAGTIINTSAGTTGKGDLNGKLEWVEIKLDKPIKKSGQFIETIKYKGRGGGVYTSWSPLLKKLTMESNYLKSLAQQREASRLSTELNQLGFELKKSDTEAEYTVNPGFKSEERIKSIVDTVKSVIPSAKISAGSGKHNGLIVIDLSEDDVTESYCASCLAEYLLEYRDKIEEAEYRGRKVKLGKPFLTPGGPKKRSVYVKNAKGNVIKVNFGDPNMRIKKSNPKRRKSYRARHHCENPGPRWKANYWSCRAW